MRTKTGINWRTGRKVGRTIYRQKGDFPSDEDELIGVMDTPELARIVVAAVNEGYESSVFAKQQPSQP